MGKQREAGEGNAARHVLPEVGETGLTSAQVRGHVDNGETNKVKVSTSRSFVQILRSNVFTLFNGIILAAMTMTLIAGSWKDAVFGLVIIVNTAIGVATELRAKHTLDKLSILVASRSLVRRDGDDVEITHEQIVLGDLLWIRSGEQVPADGRIVRTWGLELDESMLTGESRTVKKHEHDRVLSGSTAVSGMALVQVDAVGEHSYAATLTAKAKVYKKTESDLGHGINTILKFMTFLVVPLCVLLIWSQINTVGGWSAALSTGEWRQAVVSAVAGVVGMIPEGLVLLTSLNFAIAAMRLAHANTLVQELESVETLARVDCLNLDKTGTVTDGGIAFEAMVPLDDENAHAAADAHAATEVAQALFDISNEENPNATARAVVESLQSQGYAAGAVAQRIPFSSVRKWSAILSPSTGVWTMGAPEILLDAFSGERARQSRVRQQVRHYADQGYRVLLIARNASSRVPTDFADNPQLIAGSEPVALVLCSEHIRDDAEATLAWFREQGVRCRVISGDNAATVGAIAAKVRLTGEREPKTMDARELPSDVNELAKVMEGVDVLGRVLPDQKKTIVDALHAKGHVVAMTGDGVNDALAIKEADLGIAMGNAAPATKAVAQVVLVDSKFSHLPDVVARGRQVMANMERVASLFLVKTVYSALISLGVVLTAIPFPYLPRHITYIGALTIGVPAFILALAPNTRRYIPGFLRRVVEFALPGGVAVALSVLLASWLLPGMMGWRVSYADDLQSLRATCAVIMLVLGLLVLARVSRPLNSWRGVLVAAMAIAGVLGILIPVVQQFFALRIAFGPSLIVTLSASAAATAIYGICLAALPPIIQRVSHIGQSAGN